MSLLREIQTAAIDNASSLEALLRKCRVLASRLKNDDLKNWVQRELNGYYDRDLPSYRQSSGQCFGHFSGPYGSGLRNAPIAEALIPKEVRPTLTRIEMREGVAAIESLLASTGSGQFAIQWDADAYLLFGQKIYQGQNLVQAWTSVPKTFLAAILSTVRNRILDFVLEIEAENPAAGEAEPTSIPIPKEQVTQIFNTHIHGSVGNLASGHTISQSGDVSISQGNLKALEAALRDKGLDASDINLLRAALKVEPRITGTNFGPTIASWLGKMVCKAAEGTWKVSADVAGSLLTSYLKQYYGLP